MRLAAISETQQKTIQLLRRAGVDITTPAIQKLLRAEPASHRQAGGGNELETLENGTRLVAWMAIPPPGYDSIRRGHTYLVFLPHNRDVAELIASLPNGSPASDLVNGLAFGYGYAKTIPWAGERAFRNAVYQWLEKRGIRFRGVCRRSGNKAVLNGGTKELRVLVALLTRLGMSFERLSSHEITFDAPDDLTTDLGSIDTNLTNFNKRAGFDA